MLDPSKPSPSVNMSSDSSRAGSEKCCQTPGRSTNRRSMIWILASFASFFTSLGDFDTMSLPFSRRRYSDLAGRQRAGADSFVVVARNGKCKWLPSLRFRSSTNALAGDVTYLNDARTCVRECLQYDLLK